MKKNIELLMAKQFAELAVCNLDAVMGEQVMDFKHELEYYLYILHDESLTYQDKVEVLEEKIKERLKSM